MRSRSPDDDHRACGGTPAIIFTGPTLPSAKTDPDADITFHPPVGQGDVFRAMRSQPRVIGIIDGVFETQPSVWHKEILWALSQGVHVVGAGSMGALRAAELHQFGMIGIGRVFEAYRDGELTDDDEVAVMCGPPDAGYRPVSDALVNMRFSFAEAVRQGITLPDLAERLISIAKTVFFKQRTYRSLFDAARRHDLPGAELARLETWLGNERIDQKKTDAEALLRHVTGLLNGKFEPAAPAFELNHTTLFRAAMDREL